MRARADGSHPAATRQPGAGTPRGRASATPGGWLLDAWLFEEPLAASLLEGPRVSLLDASLLEARLATQRALDLLRGYVPGRRGQARGGQGGLSISFGKDGEAKRGKAKPALSGRGKQGCRGCAGAATLRAAVRSSNTSCAGV